MKQKSKKKTNRESLFLYCLDDNLSYIMQSNVFGKNEFTKEQYNSALNCVEKQAFIIRKRKPRGGNIELHNTVILKHLKSIMSIQDVTSVYAMLRI